MSQTETPRRPRHRYTMTLVMLVVCLGLLGIAAWRAERFPEATTTPTQQVQTAPAPSSSR